MNHNEQNIAFLDSEIEIAEALRTKYLAEQEAGNDTRNMRLLIRYNQHRIDSMKRMREFFATPGQVVNAGFDSQSFFNNMAGFLDEIRSGKLMYESGGATLIGNEEDGSVQLFSTLVFKSPNAEQEM
jgi:hypothetical protein